MATDKNPMSTVVNILKDNWNAANADNKTPVIAKIYEYPKTLDLKLNDYVLVYLELTPKSHVGIGSAARANVREELKIDIRIGGNSTDDSHARNVLTEVNRIIFSNIVNPDASFPILDPYGDTTDLSDKLRKIWRYVISIALEDNCRDMTA